MKIRNMNDFAIAVTKLEGGKKNLTIAQVKEVLKCAKKICLSDLEVFRMFVHYLTKLRGKA